MWIFFWLDALLELLLLSVGTCNIYAKETKKQQNSRVNTLPKPKSKPTIPYNFIIFHWLWASLISSCIIIMWLCNICCCISINAKWNGNLTLCCMTELTFKHLGVHYSTKITACLHWDVVQNIDTLTDLCVSISLILPGKWEGIRYSDTMRCMCSCMAYTCINWSCFRQVRPNKRSNYELHGNMGIRLCVVWHGMDMGHDNL